MLTTLVVIAAVACVFAIPSPDMKALQPPTVVEHHHHHYRVTIVRHQMLIQAQIDVLAVNAMREPEPVRFPEARSLVRSTTASQRYLRGR
ncbi:MAG: hypothetical protein AAB554_04035 [Patescibacteria group bacterium]